jgi:YVTN family beta-propeller protein
MSEDDGIGHVGTFEGARIRPTSFAVGLLVLLFSLGCGGASTVNTNGNGGGGRPVAAAVSGTIAVGTAPSGITVDSTHNKIYVADSGNPPTGTQPCSTGADVMVIDGATESTAAAGFPVPLPNYNPIAVAYNPVTQMVDVGAREFGCGHIEGVLSIDPANPATASLIYQFFVQNTGTVRSIAIDQASGDIFLGIGVSEEGASFSSIAVLGDDGTFKAGIPVGSLPTGLALNTNPGASTLYAGTAGGTFGFQGPSISVIDKATNTVTATISFPAAGWITVAVNPSNNTIYAANEQSNNVSVIDGATNAVTATIPVGNSPTGIAVNPQTNFIYVANSGFQHANDRGSVTVINGKDNTTTTLTDPNAIGPQSVAVNPVTNKIYVTNSNSDNVTVIDGAHD